MFKKNQLIGIILFATSISFLSSCSKSPENLKTIPQDTNLITVIDLYSIIKKGGMDEISEIKFFRSLKKEVRNENKKVSKIIDNIIENPTISGINFKTDLFIYSINEAKDENFICVSAEIKNKEKFEEFIEDVLDKTNLSYDIEKEKKYSYTLVNNEFAIGWDNDKVILLGASNYQSRTNLDLEIETLFELKEKEQISSNTEFNQFYKNKKDISLWISTNILEDNYQFKKIEKQLDFDITGNYISSFINFDDDNITLTTKFTPNSDIQKMMKENNPWNNKFNSKLLHYFPKKSYAYASFSIDPMSYYKMFEEDDNFDKIQSEFEKETSLELEDLFKSINGNAIFSLFGFENMEYTYMDWGYSFDENIAKLLDQKYAISEAGYLSTEEKEQLNEGKTIKCKKYSRKYSINIKNIIQNGGNIETAIENNDKINWYQGGWDFGKNIETKKEEFLPLMGVAIDINDNKLIKELINKIPEDKLTKHTNYYEFQFEERYPSYFAYNENILFITNDIKSVKSFKNGGYSSENLSDSKNSSYIENNNIFSFINLNFDEYPKNFKKKILENQTKKDVKMYKIWNEFAESIHFKKIDDTSIEIAFVSKNKENNILKTIITTIDDNYKYFMNR